jgi:hypothetical protein
MFLSFVMCITFMSFGFHLDLVGRLSVDSLCWCLPVKMHKLEITFLLRSFV